MGKLAWIWLLVLVATVSVQGILDLTGIQAANGTWRGSITLPCVYEPSADFKELSVIWKASQDGLRTIFHRDASSGDQVLLTAFKRRLSVAKKSPGDVSLLIHELEMTDTGQYTCEVTWEARNKSMITKGRTTTLKVVKVPVTKPVITPHSIGSLLSSGERTSLKCSANGSPPIRYQWFKEVPGSNDEHLGTAAVLAFDRLRTSDTGRYYCVAQNKISTQRQQSDAIQLTVQDSTELSTLHPESEVPTPPGTELPTLHPEAEVPTPAGTAIHTYTSSEGPVATSRSTKHNGATSGRQGARRASLPLHLVILIGVLSAFLVIVVGSVIFCRRKPKSDNTYEVSYNNYAMANGENAPAGLGVVGVCGGSEYEEPSQLFGNNYTVEPTRDGAYVAMDMNIDTEYEILSNKMESEYEIGS